MRITVEPLTPILCCVTARPSLLERLLGVRGYRDRFAARNVFGGWTWDLSTRLVDPKVLEEIRAAYRAVEWRALSTAPPG